MILHGCPAWDPRWRFHQEFVPDLYSVLSIKNFVYTNMPFDDVSGNDITMVCDAVITVPVSEFFTGHDNAHPEKPHAESAG